MSDNSIARVHYFEGQFLRTQDFVDEQAYHVAMRRRHNIAHHTWGIVSGLEIVIEEGNFFLQPGMAVDGFGRELILPQKRSLSSSAFKDKGSNEIDVWLTYGLTSSDQATAGFAGCDNGKQNGASFYRWQETAQILLTKPDPDFPDRRAPKEVPINDRNFPPSRTPPDNPEISWPVFLGQIINDPANQEQPLQVKFDNRPYVGLVGEAITSASGSMRVQVGNDPDESGPRRFAVLTRNETSVTPPWLPRIEIDPNGELTVQGNATMQGNLMIAGGAVEFKAGPARDLKAPTWDIYHYEGTEDPPPGSTNKVPVHELRIEMPAPPAGGFSGTNRVVIGTWSKQVDAAGVETEQFHPCLTIRDNCNVEVAGDLVVKGQITARAIVGARLSDAARNAVSSALTSGILATSARLGELPDPAALVGAPRISASLEDFATRLERDPTFRNAFVERMKNSTLLTVTLPGS